MRKSDIAAHVADRASLSRAQAEDAVNALFEAIRGALASGETVSLAGLGTFSTRSRPARSGRDPRTGESIAIGRLEDAVLQGRQSPAGHGALAFGRIRAGVPAGLRPRLGHGAARPAMSMRLPQGLRFQSSGGLP